MLKYIVLCLVMAALTTYGGSVLKDSFERALSERIERIEATSGSFGIR